MRRPLAGGGGTGWLLRPARRERGGQCVDGVVVAIFTVECEAMQGLALEGAFFRIERAPGTDFNGKVTRPARSERAVAEHAAQHKRALVEAELHRRTFLGQRVANGNPCTHLPGRPCSVAVQSQGIGPTLRVPGKMEVLTTHPWVIRTSCMSTTKRRACFMHSRPSVAPGNARFPCCSSTPRASRAYACGSAARAHSRAVRDDCVLIAAYLRRQSFSHRKERNTGPACARAHGALIPPGHKYCYLR